MPSEAEFIAKLGNRRKLGEVPVLEATEAQLNKAAEKPSLPRPAATAPPSVPPARRPPPTRPSKARNSERGGATRARRHRVAVAGASGRMGQMLIEAVGASADCQLTGALDVASSPAIGTDAAAFTGRASGVLISADIRQGLKDSRVLIDFTRPEGTLAHLAACRELGVKLVIGTTGFSDAQKAEIAAAAKDIAIVMAPNMSVGVNVTLKLLEMAAQALSTGYDIEIVEAHHRHKVDAPSGTALKMGEVIAERAGPRPEGLRRLCPRRRDRRARPLHHRLFRRARRRRRGRPHRDVRWAPASASRSATSRPAAATMPRAACAPRASWTACHRPFRHVRRAGPEKMNAGAAAAAWFAPDGLLQPDDPGRHRQPAGGDAAAGHVGGELGRDPLENLAAAARRGDVARSTAAFWQSASVAQAAKKSPPSTARRWCCR
jgi:dihydrodipicolinate reductase